VRALAIQTLLEARGYPARLCLGFARTNGHAIAGHAWVESSGRVFDGPGDPSRDARAAGSGTPSARPGGGVIRVDQEDAA